MRDWRMWVKVAMFVAFLTLVANDVWRPVKALYDLDGVTGEMAAAIALAPGMGTPESSPGYASAVVIAKDKNVEIAGLNPSQTGVTVTGRTWVRGTWVIGPVIAWLGHRPLSSPIEITASKSANYLR